MVNYLVTKLNRIIEIKNETYEKLKIILSIKIVFKEPEVSKCFS